MDLFSALPLLRGWSYRRFTFDVETGQKPLLIPPGNEKTLVDQPGVNGWIIELAMTTTCPNAFYIYSLGPDAAKEFKVSAYELKRQNRVLPAAAGFYATVLDKTLLPGRKTVTTAGTPVTLGSRRVDGDLWVRALRSNTGVVRLSSTSDKALAAATSITLDPGETVTLNKPGNLIFLYLDAVVSGEGVEFSHESEDHTFEALETVTTSPLYVFCMTPATPVPFRNGFQVRVQNPDYAFATQAGALHDGDMRIQKYLMNLLVIDDETELIEDYQRLIGVKG